ncbi:MAG: aspartate aminotransferase family protein [Bacteroidales bacterium]|nr:aspartate aminotransferase family protein [Bacteroidales bacterium]MCF8387330.1 aspartate aminotransferase family protein [Bacteroidales bacterium]MCF8398038.1 aspartate aminotransferase family protein [Bacteroidales bacterium]
MLTNRQVFYQHLGLPSDVPLALEIVKAEGIYLWDDQGNRYTDLVSGVSVSNLGHGNKAVKQAITEQLDAYMHLMVYGKYIQSPQTRLASKLAERMPEKLDCTYFVNSGSEAIEGALKLAKRYTGRTEIISFKNAYHGGTHGALSVGGNEEMKYAFRPLLPDIRQLNFNETDDIDQITDRTACVLLEPIQAEAGIIIPDRNYLKKLRNRCDETGSLLLFDEIQMGMGRTGKMFCYEHFEVIPDILCLAKAFGGGMPLGAFISSKKIMNTLTHNPALGHITTFGGHPVSCAASLAAINEMEKMNLIEGAQPKGNLFVSLLQDHPCIKKIRCKGLMLGIDLESVEKTTRLVDCFRRNRIIVDRFLFKADAFRIAPPLIINEEQIRETAKAVLSCLDKLS